LPDSEGHEGRAVRFGGGEVIKGYKLQGKNLHRCIDSHTNLRGGRCRAAAYRLTKNDRIWLDLDGEIGRARVSLIRMVNAYSDTTRVACHDSGLLALSWPRPFEVLKSTTKDKPKARILFQASLPTNANAKTADLPMPQR
jgi:hypothetical protein